MYSYRHLGASLALASAIFMGVSHSVIVLAYRGGSDPLTASAGRFVLPFIVLLLFLMAQRRPLHIPGWHGIAAFVLGLLTGLYNLALMHSLNFLPAPIAMLVFYLFPIIIAIIVVLLRWAPVNRNTAIAAVVAFFGIALALGARIDNYSLVGLVLAFLGALGMAVVSVLSTRIIAASDPLRLTLYMSFGALTCLFIVIGLSGEVRLPTTVTGWLGFWLSHLGYTLGIVSYFVAISRIGPVMTATLLNLQPLVVIAVAFSVLSQSITMLQLVGSFVVVGALIAATRAQRGSANTTA